MLEKFRLILFTYTRKGLVKASLATFKLFGVFRRNSIILVVIKMRKNKLLNYLQLVIVNKKNAILRFEEYHDRSNILI